MPVAASVETLRRFLRGYAAVLFCRHELAGLVILAATFIRPEVGALGLLAAICAHLTARHLRYPAAEQPPEIYNALLLGLALGAIWTPTLLVIAMAVVIGVIAALATHVLGVWLWRLNRLPVMSLPFVLLMWALLLAARDAEVLRPVQIAPFPAFGLPWLDDFAGSLGNFLFTPHPAAGLAMFAALLLSSRYLALLCVCGYAVGILSLWAIGSSVLPSTIGFNFMLATMAVGGTFAFPDRTSFVWGLFAALLSGLIGVALSKLLVDVRLPPLAAPFLLATYLVLAGLASRPAGARPLLLLDAPALPEQSWRTARLAEVRLGDSTSYAVAPPFFGRWKVSQGIDGSHTHRDAWRDAFDFVVVDEKDSSFQGLGKALSDFYAFGAPVVAPISGTVWLADDAMPDNVPGEVDTRIGRNFGNYVLIRAVDGAYVLVAHLKQGSLLVRPGAWVEAGQVVGACGNSGRSSQPHIHVHVQVLPELGAPTRPLHLRAVTVQRGKDRPEYLLAARPAEGESVEPAIRDASLTDALYLPAGTQLTFAEEGGGEHVLTSELTLLGQFRLVAGGTASSAFVQLTDVLAFFDRQGGRAPCLDALVLALGLTPLSSSARSWRDAPPVDLAPLPLSLRLAINLLRPFGATFDSSYARTQEAGQRTWRQVGVHRLRLLPRLVVSVRTEAVVIAGVGLQEIAIEGPGLSRHYRLRRTGTVGDIGIAPATREVGAV